MSKPRVETTEVTVYPSGSSAPGVDDEVHHFAIRVAWRSPGLFAVLRSNGFCLSNGGTWDYERNPSSREDDWKATHRFGLDEAIALAADAVDHQTINGRTYSEWQDVFAKGVQ